MTSTNKPNLQEKQNLNETDQDRLISEQPTSKPMSFKAKESKRSGRTVIRYLGMTFLLLLGLSWMNSASKDGVFLGIAGFLFVITGISMAPPASKLFNSKFRKRSAIISFVLGLVFISVGGFLEGEKNESKNLVADKAFLNVKSLILGDNLDSAASLARAIRKQYADTLNNPAALFLKDYDSINSATFVAKSLMSLTDEEYKGMKAGATSTSFVSDPLLDSLFMKRLGSSSKQRERLLEEKRIEQEIAKEEAEYAARQKNIEAQFSRYDGSHRNLEKVIKASMNDEDSYEHIETSFSDKGNYLIVTTAFSGKNAFNATVKNAVTAKVSLGGEVLEIIQQ